VSYKSKRFGVTKVDLGDGYWAEVAPLTKAEDDETKRTLLGGDLEGAPGDVTSIRARFHQREYTDQVLLFAIKRWNLDDDAGVLLPIGVEAIQGLTDGDSTKLLAVVRGVTNPVAEPAIAKN
jgi:hypothetical protein